MATATVRLEWDPNAEPDLAGYRLYQAVDAAAFEPLAELDPSVTAFEVRGLADGTYNWRLTAFDTAGNESAPSNVVGFQVDTTAPTPPRGLRVAGMVVVTP